MVSVQIFGVKNSQATRAAERFFKERRVKIQFVDLKQKPIAPGEIKRFVERFSWAGLLDSEGKAYVDAGLKYLKLSDADLLGRTRSAFAAAPVDPCGQSAECRSRRGVVVRGSTGFSR